MPVHYRMQCLIGADSALPKDRFSINPCFRDSGATSDPDNLAHDLIGVLQGYFEQTAREIVVKAYDLEGTPPVYPAATASANVGAYPPSHYPREVAICLSYYADHNVPRRRGRLFIPATCLFPVTPVRPTATIMNQTIGLVDGLAALGGPDVDWILWSHTDKAAHRVTTAWVDDEWDTIRSRGLKPSTRVTKSTSG